MSISKEQAQKVASLGRLQLTSGEEEKYAAELSHVLGYVDQLSELTARGEEVPPLVISPSELRPDEHDGGRFQAEIIDMAPNRKDNYLAVPAVL